MRTHIKRLVMNAYCAGLMPAAAVKVVFRVFKLKHL